MTKTSIRPPFEHTAPLPYTLWVNTVFSEIIIISNKTNLLLTNIVQLINARLRCLEVYQLKGSPDCPNPHLWVTVWSNHFSLGHARLKQSPHSEAKTQQTSAQDCLQHKQDSNQNQTGVPKMRQVSYQKLLVIISIYTRCGHVVRDFESEAKTRCNFQF